MTAKLWTEGDKALAHFHLAYAGVPSCDEERALRLFVADELIEAGVMPAALMKAQGFDPAPLNLLKANFNPGQLRWAAGNGRDSGRWSGGAGIDTAGVVDFLARLLREAARRAARLLLRPTETKPPNPEIAKPETKPLETPETELPSKVDTNKLHHIFDKVGRGLDDLIADFGSQEAAFESIKNAIEEAIKRQNISGKYEIEIEVRGHKLTVRGTVMNDGTIKIGTVFP